MKNESYEEFVEKFKPKKTTDDCYTPPTVYRVIRDWVCAEYGINPANIVRPFYPGGDYVNFEYATDAVVVDNPPFSILTQICEFYLDREIPFFLFAPTLTCLSGKNTCMRMNHIICDASITYENGAVVKTSFVTNIGGATIAQSEPRLTNLINAETKRLMAEKSRSLPKYEYPRQIVTAAHIQKYSRYGVDFKVHRNDCMRVSALDSQRQKGKTIFGGGLLLSEKAAAEKEAENKFIFELSEREKEKILILEKGYAENQKENQ